MNMFFAVLIALFAGFGVGALVGSRKVFKQAMQIARLKHQVALKDAVIGRLKHFLELAHKANRKRGYDGSSNAGSGGTQTDAS